MLSYIFSILFNLSKFFEVTCLYHPVGGYDTSGNNSTDIPLNITSTNYSDICQPQVLTILCKYMVLHKNSKGMLIIVVIKSVSPEF